MSSLTPDLVEDLGMFETRRGEALLAASLFFCESTPFLMDCFSFSQVI